MRSEREEDKDEGTQHGTSTDGLKMGYTKLRRRSSGRGKERKCGYGCLHRLHGVGLLCACFPSSGGNTSFSFVGCFRSRLGRQFLFTRYTPFFRLLFGVRGVGVGECRRMEEVYEYAIVLIVCKDGCARTPTSNEFHIPEGITPCSCYGNVRYSEQGLLHTGGRRSA